MLQWRTYSSSIRFNIRLHSTSNNKKVTIVLDSKINYKLFNEKDKPLRSILKKTVHPILVNKDKLEESKKNIDLDPAQSKILRLKEIVSTLLQKRQVL